MDSAVVKGNLSGRLAQVVLKLDDLDGFSNSLVEMLAEAFGIGRVTLLLLDEACGQYRLKACFPADNDKPFAGINNRNNWLKDRQRVISLRLLDEYGSRMSPELKRELADINTFVSLPLFSGEALIGILNLGPKINEGDFSKKDLKILSQLTELLAALIHQAVSRHNLREQKLHHQNILDKLVSGIIAVDPANKITIFNRAAERILKVKAEQVLGKEVHLLQANLVNLLLNTLHKGKSYHREELNVLPENTLLGVSTSQFYGDKGKLLGVCMVFNNLTGIKKKEMASRQRNLNAYWSNVANSLAHEVKNSIVAAKVLTEMFPQKYDDAEFRWSLYSALKRDMEKLDNFSENLLSFTRVPQLVIQPCRMEELIDAAVNSALKAHYAGKITVEKRYARDIPAVSGDYHQLQEAFTCIILNALEVMGRKGKLTISIEEETGPEMLTYSLPEAVSELPAGGIVVVKITDTGYGILPEDLPYLFDPFFTRKEASSGLGLSYARKIVQMHSGSVRAESKAGKGSTFWVCLPTMHSTGQAGLPVTSHQSYGGEETDAQQAEDSHC
jgi:two-component system sensor histidine kinase AtoS